MAYDPGQYPLGQGSVDERPWPGGVQAPQHIAAPASGEATFTAVGVASFTRPPSGWSPIVQWRSPKPAPVVLQINAVNNVQYVGAADPYSAELFLPTQLSAQVAPSTKAGVLRVTYGVGNSQRVLEVDVRSGSFQLPVVDFVSVEGLAYGLAPWNFRVGASVTPGLLGGDGARFTNTWRPTVGAGAYKTEPVPFGARWMALSSDQYDLGGAGVKLRLFQAGGPLIVHDYANTVFVGAPGQAIELASRSAVFLYNDGAAPAYCTVKFYLEP